MSEFEQELEATAELVKSEKISREQARAHARSTAWIRENQPGIVAAGWTVADLFKVGTLSFPYSDWGPGWLTLWNNEKCEPRLGSRGNIEFVLHEAGGDVVQTCWLKKSFLN